MGREWRFVANKTTGALNGGAMSSDEYPYMPVFNTDIRRLRVYFADPDQPNEAQPNPATQKDDVSVPDADQGVLVDLSAQEISDRAEALQLVSLDYIAELPEGDPVRLTHQAMFCLAKHAGEGDLDDDSTFGEYLTWVASGA